VRWTWLIPRLILVALIWSAFVFGLDPWLRSTAVESTQAITGAKVDIGTFTTELFPPVLNIRNVALASASSPGTNLVEFDDLQFRLGGQSLLRKSFVVEEAELTGVRFGTIRNDDGQLDVVPEPDPGPPSWLAEKLQNIGDEWLDQLALDVREQLDPNTLETWRTGQALSVKWEQEIETLQHESESFKPRVDRLQQRMDAAKKIRSIEQVQEYLQLASEGEQLLRQANQMQQRIQGLVPEVQQDLLTLDQARKNDQEQVVQKIRQLKPNPRRITESLIGPEMYRQLDEVLSWMEFGSNYQKELRKQTRVVRYRGEDVGFPLLNPTPRFLCRRMKLSGELSLDQQLMPFHALLTGVSSDPVLLGQPTEFLLKTAGEKPLQLAIRHDATTEFPRTDMIADFHQSQPKSLSVGKSDTAVLTARLTDLKWSAHLLLMGNNIDGQIQLNSNLQQVEFTSATISPIIRNAVTDVFHNIKTVDATIQIAGTVRAPTVEITSSFGEGIATGLQTVFANQAQQAKALLSAKVAELATEQKQRLSAELNSRYQELVADHKATLKKINGAQQLLVSLRSGQANPAELFRQVSGSGILSKKKEDRVLRQMEQSQKLLQGLGGGIFR